MPNAGTQTDEEAIPCPAIDGGCGAEFMCVVCGHSCCNPCELEGGWTDMGQEEPVIIPVCGLYCFSQLESNHHRTHSLPDPGQKICSKMFDVDEYEWRVENGDGIVFTEKGEERVFLNAYRESGCTDKEGHYYIPRVCITLACLKEIMANQEQ